MLTFKTNALAAAAYLKGIGWAILTKGRPAVIRAAGELALKEKVEAIDDPTYQRPETRSSTGRPLWTRTGNWIGGQVMEMGRNRVTVTTQGPAAAYEGAMAFRNTSRMDGINRSNDARGRALPRIEKKLERTATDAFNKAVGL